MDMASRRSASLPSIQVPVDTAFTICDGLLRITHSLMIQLPDSELRDIRCIINAVLARADHLLETSEDVSLDFTGLSISDSGASFHLLTMAKSIAHPPSEPLAEDFGEEFGAVVISKTVTTTTHSEEPTPSTSRPANPAAAQPPGVRFTRVQPPPLPPHRIPTPAPTPVVAPAPAPAPPTPTPVSVTNEPRGPLIYHGSHPLILSFRNNVGFPDYAWHPYFTRPGKHFVMSDP